MTFIQRFAAALLTALALSAASTVTPAQTVTFIHTDPVGTPLMATDTGGNVVWKENYKPYGEEQANPPAVAGNHLGFTGKPFDDATGLAYFGSRYYDPVLGRFTGVDPAPPDPNNLLHSLNLYAYGNNNPYRYVDPDGRIAVPAFALPSLLIGAAWWVTRSPEQREQMIRDVRNAVGWLKGLVFNEAASTGGQEQAKPAKANDAHQPPAPGDIPSVDWNDPSKPPKGRDGTEWEWRGKPPQGGEKGGYVNPANPDQSVHPDLNHPDPVGPHWDFTDRGRAPSGWRVFPDGSIKPK